MKNIFVSLAVLSIAVSCSKTPLSRTDNSEPKAPSAPQTAYHPKPIDPNRIVLVQTEEHKERIRIEEQARAYVAAKDFTHLEQMADRYRTSKECYPTGMWKLVSVYSGMAPDSSSPDKEWEACLATLRQWVQSDPESITARVGLADALVNYGWKARGSGLADTVTPQGWRLLKERLNEAIKVLEPTARMTHKCPHAWSVQLQAGLGLGVGKEDYITWFEKAISSNPDYTEYYCKMAMYLHPRWGGKPEAFVDFVKTTADKFGGEAGDVLYARMAWYAQGCGGNVFLETDLPWDRADRGFIAIENQFPDSLYVQNARAYIAVMGCEKTLAPRALVDGLEGRIDPGSWTSKENFIRLTRSLYPM
jgi:hypothetical protein